MSNPVFDIACIGTSLTSNRVGDWQASLISRLQLVNTTPIRCYDGGIPGAKSADALLPGRANISKLILLRPRVVLIEYGMNDAPPGAGVSVAQFKTNLTNVVNQFLVLAPQTAIYLMTMNPIVVPPGSAPDAAALPSYYQGVRDVAAAKGVGLIDNAVAYAGITAADVDSVGVHPTYACNQARLLPSLMSVIQPLLP